jgi:hypothetical protein
VRRSFQEDGMEVQLSRQVEGSQHTGIAEIMSGKASFISQFFFNSEISQKGNKSGKQEGTASFLGSPTSLCLPSSHLLES